MQSFVSELKLLLGDSLQNEVCERAKSLKMTPEQWVFIFLAKGRLTPELEEEANQIFLSNGR